MTPVYPTVRVLLDENDDDIPETDISGAVATAITGQAGSFTQKETDRIASAGSISFGLNNNSGTLTGAYYAGKAVSVTLTYGGREKQIFYGHVAPSVSEDSGFILPRRLKLTVQDWLHVANNTRLTSLALTTNKRADEALSSLMDTLTNPPAREEFDTGQEVFANMFDGSGNKAKIYSELDKITKSELGYLYLKHREDGIGEVLRFEGMYSRGTFRGYARVPENTTARGLLKYHGNAGASGYLKFHGNAGASGRIKIDEATVATFGESHYDADWVSGKSMVNEFGVTNVFRRTDASRVVLYKITYPVKIGTVKGRAGGGYIINGNYSDPLGGTVLQAFDVVLEASDWDFNSSSDGTGTDLSANLDITFTPYSNRFRVSFRNSGPPGYLTLLQVRGKGIYKYSPAEILLENVESKERMKTEISDNLTREYSSDLITSSMFATRALALNRLPRQELLSVSYHANISENNLLGFMYLEQGDKIYIGETVPYHNGAYYIQGVKFTIKLGGIINYTWYLKEEIGFACTPIAVSAPSATVGTRRVALDWGILPHLSNMPEFSYSAWVRRDAVGAFGPIIDRTVDEGTGRRGNWLILSGRTLLFNSYKTPTDGNWVATDVIPNDFGWHHVAVTYNNTSDSADPIIYVDGSSVAVTETLAPAGSTDDDSDVSMKMFNVGPDPATSDDYYYDTMQNYSLKDVRVYNRILSAAEVATIEDGLGLYSTVPFGKVFHGIFAPTTQIDDYINDTIEDDDLVLESVHGCGGTPFNQDTSSATLMLTGETI